MGSEGLKLLFRCAERAVGRSLVGLMLVGGPVLAAVAHPGAALADSSASDMPVGASGYQVSALIQGGAGYSHPDPIVVADGNIYVAYQNDSKADGSNGKASTIVQYSLDGTAGKTFSIAGHCDGMRMNPDTGLLWATVNEDANAALDVIDPKTGTIKTYQFSSATHGGGYDDLAFVDGKAFVAASNPSVNSAGISTGPAVDLVTLQGSTADVTPVLMGNASAYDTTTNKTVTLNLVDPDSMIVDPQGDVVLVDQAGSDLVFLHRPGTAQQSVTHVPAGTQLEDTVWVNAAKGRLFVVDSKKNTVYAISGSFKPGTVFTEAPSDSGVTNFVGTIDLSSGNITPIAIGFGKATGLLFVPDPDAPLLTPAATDTNSSPEPTGTTAAAATGSTASSGSTPAGAADLQSSQTGTLIGTTGGSFAYYQIANPTAGSLTLTLALGAYDASVSHAIGLNVYQDGTKLKGATALATGLHDAITTTAPSVTVTMSASGGPVLIQVFNYAPTGVSYTLTKS